MKVQKIKIRVFLKNIRKKFPDEDHTAFYDGKIWHVLCSDWDVYSGKKYGIWKKIFVKKCKIDFITAFCYLSSKGQGNLNKRTTLKNNKKAVYENKGKFIQAASS